MNLDWQNKGEKPEVHGYFVKGLVPGRESKLFFPGYWRSIFSLLPLHSVLRDHDMRYNIVS
jgi:hypothetical protein